jgi:hypothetical protein
MTKTALKRRHFRHSKLQVKTLCEEAEELELTKQSSQGEN